MKVGGSVPGLSTSVSAVPKPTWLAREQAETWSTVIVQAGKRSPFSAIPAGRARVIELVGIALLA